MTCEAAGDQLPGRLAVCAVLSSPRNPLSRLDE